MSTSPTGNRLDREPMEFALRVGSVPYLNVQPLIWAFEKHADLCGLIWPQKLEITSAVPSRLAEDLRRDIFDVAIVPVFEYLQNPIYTVIPGVAIATRGAVASVMLHSASPLGEVTTIELDTSSLTSVHLLKVLLAERGLGVEYKVGTTAGTQLSPGTARLLIGDPAMNETGRHPHNYDLGEMWRTSTGLPFVFAAWLVHPKARCLPLSDVFQKARNMGMAELEQVAAEWGPKSGKSPAAALDYFRRNLCFELGPRELEGWREYARLCHKHGFISDVPTIQLHEF
ncbi:MAG: menaquinone biosynthesis protein [Candidatus Sumerlaeaceae bacterium]|nr:menaquinone biosynthesis protein [Candidatus Sumerlaeaceae bacterium]